MFNLESISDKEDKVLIKDAIELCKQNQCRAAFIIGWLACAESLRRRIKFLGKTSNNAKKAFQRIESEEASKHSIDFLLIDESSKLEIITPIEKSKLEYFYNLRCIYCHPYEKAPSKLDCEHLIVSIIQIVLSKSTLLREDGISEVIKLVENEESFLSGSEDAIKSYVENFIPRIDPEKYEFLINKLIKSFEHVKKDNLFIYKRIKAFTINTLFIIGVNSVFRNNSESEKKCLDNKNFSVEILSTPEIFKALNSRLEDIVFNILLEKEENEKLNCLYINKCLDETLTNLLKANLEKIEISHLIYYTPLLSCKLLIKHMNTGDFYKQNEVAHVLLSSNNIDLFDNCDEAELFSLGYMVSYSLRCNSFHMQRFVSNQSVLDNYPIKFIQGMICGVFFTAEDCKSIYVSNKNNCLKLVIEYLKHLKTVKVDSLNSCIDFLFDHLSKAEKVISLSADTLELINNEDSFKKISKMIEEKEDSKQ